MTIAAKPILVDTAEAAELLSVRPEQIRLWERDGRMPRAVNLNGNRRFLVRDLERWAEANRSLTEGS
jgi:DNA-binding transcriptional MerR regulator